MADELRRALGMPLREPEQPEWAAVMLGDRSSNSEPSADISVRRTSRGVRIVVRPTPFRFVNDGHSAAASWVLGMVAVLLVLCAAIASWRHQRAFTRADAGVAWGLFGGLAALVAIGTLMTRRRASRRAHLTLRENRLRVIEAVGRSLRRYRWQRSTLFAVHATTDHHGHFSRCLEIVGSDGRTTVLLSGKRRGDIEYAARLLNEDWCLPTRRDRSLAAIGQPTESTAVANANDPSVEYEAGGALGISRRPGFVRFTEPQTGGVLRSLGWGGITFSALFFAVGLGILTLMLLLALVKPGEVVVAGLKLAAIMLVMGLSLPLVAWCTGGTLHSVDITADQLRWRAERGSRWRERTWPLEDIAAIRRRDCRLLAVKATGFVVPLLRAGSKSAAAEMAREMQAALGLAPPRPMNDIKDEVDYTPRQ
jgi:hypothetical protein